MFWVQSSIVICSRFLGYWLIIDHNDYILRNTLHRSIFTLCSARHQYEGSIQHHLRRMLNDGVIRREGSTKAGTWVIVKQ